MKRAVIIKYDESLLNDEEINAILKTPRVKQAFIQLIEEFRQEAFVNAPAYAGGNNALAMARELGGAEVCNGMLLAIQERTAEKKELT